MGWCTILLAVHCVHIHSSFPLQCMNKLRQHEYNVTVSATPCERQCIDLLGTPQAVPLNSECCWEFWLNGVNYCGLYWHLLHFQSPYDWPSNVQLSFYQVLCSCQNFSCIAFASGAPILWQYRPQRFLSAAAQYAAYFDPYWRQKNHPSLLSIPLEKYGKIF